MGLARATYSEGLKLLLAISGFVLMIVCANMANLMLVRGIARRRQTSISLALGAARGRILRQALTESVMLGLIGGAAGIGIAFAGTRALLSGVFVGATSLPIDATPDLSVLAFAVVVSIVTGLVFGVGPAWSATRADPIDALRGAGRSTQHSSFAQRGLVVTQAALSLVLLTAAGQLILSLRNEANQKFGFVSEGRIAVRIDPNLAGYKVDQLDALYRRIQDTLARLPGVLNVSYALFSPMSGSNWTTDVSFEGRPPGLDGENSTSWARVGPGYFDTIGTAILRGRPILESDIDSTRHVAVVNEAFAQRFFPGEDPMGKHFGARQKFEKSFEIVGIAANAKYREPDQPPFPMFFLSRPQVTHYDNAGTMAFESRSLYVNDIVLHVAGADLSMDEPIRRAFAGIDPNLPIFWIQSFEKAKIKQLGQPALIARLTSLFGLTALLLASIGLYGVTTYAVAQRSKEIGIRVVLGADRRSVVQMVLRNAYVLVAVGLGFGIPLAIVMGRLIRSRLFGVGWYNPTILCGAAAVLGVCALLATIVPARRAASLEPLETLRGD
jgi:predicted permease